MRFASSSLAALVLSFGPLLTGCPMDEGDPPQNDAGCGDDWQEDFLGEVSAAGGDLGCFDGTLSSPPAAEACQSTIALNGITVDHQNSTPVGDMAVEVYFADNPSAASDLSFTSDSDGTYTGEIPACQALAYRTDRGDPSQAPITLQQHKVLSPEEQPITYEFRSVATATVNLITSPLFFGIEIEEGKGMLFGKVVGCDYEAVTNIQVLLRDAVCRVPSGSLVGYTTNELPDPGARATTADGFFFVMNVPPGDYTLEAWRVTGDGNELIGSAPAQVDADGVGLVDVFVGRDDGQVMPAECLSCD